MTSPECSLSAARPTGDWYRVTPGRLVLALLAAQGLLLMSERFRWFAFNEQKGWTVLIAMASLGVTVAVMLLWFVAALVLRWRFQFSIRSLLVLTAAVAVPCSWLASEIQQATRQKEAEEAIANVGGSMYYDYQVVNGDQIDPNRLPSSPAWVRDHLGNTFFEDVVAVDVRGWGVSDELVARLRSFPRLKWLVLRGTEVTDAGLEHIEALHALRGLTLDASPITDGGLKHVTALKNLQSLGLAHTAITDAGLARLESLTELEVLDLAATGVTDRGMDHVKQLTNLRRLGLRQCGITDAGLLQLSNLKNLEHVGLWYTQVTASGIRELKRQLPGVEIPYAAPDVAASEMAPMATDASDAASVLDRQGLQGTWILTEIQEGSEKRTASGERIEFKGDEIYILTTETVEQHSDAPRGKFRLNATKTPKWLDHNVGARWLLGVYSLEGDTIRLNTVGLGEPRPKDFTKAFIFKREKESGK
jgi:uncharacterized protein (TIGR03067 family)